MSLPHGLRIRTYEPRDLDHVWALHREGIVRQDLPERPVSLSEWDADFEDIEGVYLDGGNFWVVEGPGGLVAINAIMRIDGETARLRRMRVTAAWRRRGVARALVHEAIAFCRQTGFRWIILDTLADQTSAQRLYEGAGFVRTGERQAGPYRLVDYALELS